uniref:Uncharacterized protein n=1 Tax=Anguilla anguilla TaxID=7936 RepID=A0A0E9SRA0_ANGAN
MRELFQVPVFDSNVLSAFWELIPIFKNVCMGQTCSKWHLLKMNEKHSIV